MFRLKDIKTYSIAELYNFRAKAMLSQGNGHQFSQMLENRIEKIGKELEQRGQVINEYTYDIKENNIAVIRHANKNDIEENLFNNLDVLKEQLKNEGFEFKIENQ